MADEQSEGKVSYPYMTSGQWFGVRAKLRQSLPATVDVDWVMAALGTSEKGARNVIPQLKAVGLISNDGKPNPDLVPDLRDDEAYAEACKRILGRLYPAALLSAWDNPDEDPDKVAAWFMRNAGTGATTARMQARLYLLLLKGELPSPEANAKSAARKATVPPAKKTATRPAEKPPTSPSEQTVRQQQPPPPAQPPAGSVGPNLHIDMQIHISADASDSQIDAIFKSMARHLYGRE